MSTKSIFVVSDLHLGDRGPRDNFAVGDREVQFGKFLDFVEAQNGELIIAGDLFEFWQISFSRILVARKGLLDRLAKMGAVYIVGNHDADLNAFIREPAEFLAHPFFRTMSGPVDRIIGGKAFRFMHGHEVDSFNRADSPSWGRILTIVAGIFEDRNGSTVLKNGQTVEEALEGVGEKLLRLWNWLVNVFKKPVSGGSSPSPSRELTPAQNSDRADEMLMKYRQDKQREGYDVAIVGHTHQPGHIGEWYVNSGAWVGSTNDFLRIDHNGTVHVFAWTNGKAVANDRAIPFTSRNA